MNLIDLIKAYLDKYSDLITDLLIIIGIGIILCVIILGLSINFG